MTALSLSPLAGYVWLGCAWVFIAILHRDAAKTEDALEHLKYDTTHLHEMDAL